MYKFEKISIKKECNIFHVLMNQCLAWAPGAVSLGGK
jgi:hypothetical protein